MNSRSIRYLAFSAGACALLLSLTACSQRRSTDPIKLGVITSLTGTNAAFGQAHKAGYTIAVNDINAAGGVDGRRLEIVYFDDQSKADRAVQGVAKLVDQERVSLIMGAYSSESTLAVVTQKQVPLIIPTAVADNIMASGSNWVFRLCAGSRVFATATLSPDSSAINRFSTTAGGGAFFVGRLGPITGRGASLAIIDDPILARLVLRTLNTG